MIKSSNRKSNRSIRNYVRLLWPFLLVLLVFLSTEIASGHAVWIEKVYSNGVYPAVSKILSFLSRRIAFSLWDVFWVLIIALIIIGLLLAVFRIIRFVWLTRQIICLIAFLYAFFYISWGYNYFRPEVGKRLDWVSSSDNEIIFRSVLDSLMMEASRNYVVITTADYPAFDSIIEKTYSENSHRLKINYPNGSRRPKTMIFSSIFSKSGVSGYFGPFFNEIHLNRNLLPMDYPFVLAHEKAHQFGITNEAEANLYAFIACTNSEDRRLKYSAYQSLLLYFLKDASKMKDYRDILKKVDEKVITDLRFRQEYYSKLENKTLSDIQTDANNAYLKANKIENGVRNYDQVVSLLLSWYSKKQVS